MPDDLRLRARVSVGARVERIRRGWYRLKVPAGPAGVYRLAQLDDYGVSLPRSMFRWRPPCTLSLRARASASCLPGTWGFGWWNDPFTAQSGLSGMTRRWPTLPNAAWFFYASPPGHLALRDDHPARGFLASAFRARRSWPVGALLALPALLPALITRRAFMLLRYLARLAVDEDAVALDVHPTQWHDYRLEWHVDHVAYYVDDTLQASTGVTPKAPLGLVIWIDNQYAAFPPNDRPRFGTLANPNEAWLDIADVTAEP